MRFAQALLVTAMGILLSGCPLRKQQPVVAAAPPPPQPTAPTTPPPAPQQLSIPQTNVELPSPQPISPEALATTQLPGEPAPPPATPPRNTPRVPRPKPAPSASQPAATTITEPAAAAPPAVEPPLTPAAAEPERPVVGEALSAAELQKMKDEAQQRKQEIAQILAHIPRSRRQTQKNTVDRINSFLKQIDDAEKRGDMRQANELAGRAVVMARDLKQ
jgi:hypothetical protein